MGRPTTHVLDTVGGRPAAGGVDRTLRARRADAPRPVATAATTREQSGSGLDRLSAGKFARFQEMNDAYKPKFGFPFIMAVKHSNKDEILGAFEERLGNAPEQEFGSALTETTKIARYRLTDIVGP